MEHYDETLIIGNPRDPEVHLTLTNAKLNKYANHVYTLDLTYLLDTPNETRELHFPSVHLPLGEREEIIVGVIRDCFGKAHRSAEINVGFGKTRLYVDAGGNAYYEKVIKTKTKEMTLEEIEKKLGHKVKIVNR